MRILKARVKPRWAIKEEREDEAKNPGPLRTDDAGSLGPPVEAKVHETIKLETSNVTSAITNGETILHRLADIQCIQEACLNKQQRRKFEADARNNGKAFLGGPVDPEKGKAAAGVGVLAIKGITMYPVPDPTADYLDAVASGRCLIVCIILKEVTLAVATIYGWTGGDKDPRQAARTDDIIAIVRTQFKEMPPGPKAMCGDLNGCTETFGMLQSMLEDEGWTDIGNHGTICGGKPGQVTCKANAGVRESRIDYIIANQWLTPAIILCRTDQGGTILHTAPS